MVSDQANDSANDHPTRAQRRAATAERILEAARAEFGDRGMQGATIRSIAARAGVDPSLVLQHYGSKQGLFALAVRPETVSGERGSVPQHLVDVLQIRLRELPPSTGALMRSMLTSPEAAGTMREYLQERVTNLVGPDLAGDDTTDPAARQEAAFRAALLVSSILGVTIARHFLDLEALQGVDPELIEAVAEPWFAALMD